MNAVGVCLGVYVSGLILAQYVDLPVLTGLFLYLLALAFLLFSLNRSLVFAGLLLVCLLSGWLRYPVQISPPESAQKLGLLAEQGVLRLQGRVLATQERPDGGLSVDLLLLKVESQTVEANSSARLRLYLKQVDAVPPVGSRVVFLSRVRAVRNFGTPGEFDYIRHLAYQRIWYTAYLPDDRGLAVLIDSSVRSKNQLAVLRLSGLQWLDENLTASDSVLLKALLFGEKGAMSQSLRRRLAAGGVSHLFAISGLHLGLLAFFCYAGLKYLYSRSTMLLLWQPPRRILWLPIMPLLFGYLLLTGDALATRRAFYALLIVVCLYLVRRRTSPLQLLISLAFLFLIFEPLALWQPSFLLSFSGACGILLCHKPLSHLLQPFPAYCRYPLQLFGISLSASIATLPAVLYFFHLCSPAGVLSNLFAVPLVSFVALPLGLAGLLVSSFFPILGIWLLHISAWVLQLIIDLAIRVTELPGLSAKMVYLDGSEMLAVSLGCLAILCGLRNKRFLLLIFPVFLLSAYTPSVMASPELTLFSVGQGESMLLRAAGKSILVDGGGLRSDNFDVGERLLAPALGALGVRQLDAIILTHNHPDHSGGLPFIVEHFKVKEFWSHLTRRNLPLRLQQTLQESGTQIFQYEKTGWSRTAPGGLAALSMFQAPRELTAENDRSLCLYLPTVVGGLLLTGDLEAAGVEALLKDLPPGPVSLLKAPHHGSAGSSPGLLLRRLHPSEVVVSAGFGNTYHFPSRQLREEASVRGIRLWRTDLDGTVRLRIAGQHWRVDHWSKGLFR